MKKLSHFYLKDVCKKRGGLSLALRVCASWWHRHKVRYSSHWNISELIFLYFLIPICNVYLMWEIKRDYYGIQASSPWASAHTVFVGVLHDSAWLALHRWVILVRSITVFALHVSSIIHSPELEVVEVSIAVYTHSGILSSLSKEGNAVMCYDMDDCWGQYTHESSSHWLQP